MDQLIESLRSQTDGLDLQDVTPPPAALPRVVRRGKRYAAMTAAMTLAGASGALAAVVVVAPTVIERFEEDRTPVVLDTPQDEKAPEEADGDDGLLPAIDDTPAPELAVDGEPGDDTVEEPVAAVEETDTTAPELAVLQPADGEVVTQEKVTFSGMVEPGATVKVGDWAATVADDGSWSLLLFAARGENPVTFTATDAAGNTTSVTHTIVYVPEDGGTDDGPVGELQAMQKHAELTAAPYKNIYWGTAPAGAKVAVLSEHGSGYAWANDAGDWELAVTFSPPGGTTTFPVTVKLHEHPEIRRTFELTTVSDGATAEFTANQQRAEIVESPYTNVYWGTATPGTKVKVLSDFGWEYTQADASGNWEVAVTFTPPPGTRTFDVRAFDHERPHLERWFTLTTVAADAEPFTAGQQHASVPASAPTNTYSGTGEPGHEVWIWTEAHGETSTVIGSDGSWQVSITYQGVSAGDSFAVKAKDVSSGELTYFEVTITEG